MTDTYTPENATVAALVTALNASRGTAYDTESTDSPVWLEHLAYARAIAQAWYDNTTLSEQFDPSGMTLLLSRWERILALSVPPGDSTANRQARVLAHVEHTGNVITSSELDDILTDALGAVFDEVVHTDSDDATVHWPGTSEPLAWSSSVAYIAVLLVQPVGTTDAQFYTAAAKVVPLVEPYLPAWVAVDWVRDGTLGAGVYLDDDHNLDNERFD